MKKILLFTFCLLIFSSCAVPDYEKAVSGWIQTDKDGTRTDLKFEMLEVLETVEITVSDSLSILKEQFEKQRDKYISLFERDLHNAETKISFARYAGVDLTPYQDNIDDIQAKLDSVKNQSFHSIYDGRNTEDVLAKVLKCRYAITSPILNVRQEKTESFLLSPDMKNCLGKMSAK